MSSWRLLGTAAIVVLTLMPSPTTAGSDSFEAALAAMRAGRVDEGRAMLERLEARGDSKAQLLLGDMFTAGRLLPRNMGRACDLFAKAAEAGETEAMHNLATCFFRGDGGRARDYAQSAAWYKKAADRNSVKSLCALGNQYWAGLGVPKDERKGMELCLRAAHAGHPDAQADVGSYKLQSKDYEEARTWLRKAAEQNQPEGALLYGQMLWNGDGGPQDRDRALEWFEAAARLNHRDAPYFLGRSYFVRSFDVDRRKVHEGVAERAAYWLAIAVRSTRHEDKRAEAANLLSKIYAVAPQLRAKVDRRLEGKNVPSWPTG